MFSFEITDVHGREILDSRGNPTVEAEVTIDDYIVGRASVPSGASTGKFEAAELRDGECSFGENAADKEDWKKRYNGKGVRQAVSNINTEIRKCLIGHNALEQALIDHLMCELDGTENKSRLGANAILAVSMACARACADALAMPLYKYLGGSHSNMMPVPMMNILNGGVHAKNTVDFQEFMIMPVGADSFAGGLRIGTEIYHELKKLLAADNKSTAVGDEGGFAPDLKDAFEVFDYLTRAVKSAGYEPGRDVVFAMDVAASELYQEDTGMYYFPGETKIQHLKYEMDDKDKDGCGCGCSSSCDCGTQDTLKNGIVRNTDEMIEMYEKLCSSYPIRSIEDGLNQEDWEGWKKLTEKIGDKVQLVGDDLFVTNTKLLEKGIADHCANAILVKVNQIGTLTEAFEAVEMAHKAGFRSVLSHRSGETEDTIIADIVVAMNSGQIKTGAPCRTDRVAKYNQLLRIEEELHNKAKYSCPFCGTGKCC